MVIIFYSTLTRFLPCIGSGVRIFGCASPCGLAGWKMGAGAAKAPSGAAGGWYVLVSGAGAPPG